LPSITTSSSLNAAAVTSSAEAWLPGAIDVFVDLAQSFGRVQVTRLRLLRE
jgi:hypothetical protein